MTSIITINLVVKQLKEQLNRLHEFYESKIDAWCGIAAEMGYEPESHIDVRPKGDILKRCNMFKDETRRALQAEFKAKLLSDEIVLVGAKATIKGDWDNVSDYIKRERLNQIKAALEAIAGEI